MLWVPLSIILRVLSRYGHAILFAPVTFPRSVKFRHYWELDVYLLHSLILNEKCVLIYKILYIINGFNRNNACGGHAVLR